MFLDKCLFALPLTLNLQLIQVKFTVFSTVSKVNQQSDD